MAVLRSPSETTVVAIGGHSLLDPELPPTVENQFAVTVRAMEPIADLLHQGEHLVLTHGNGPQVGFMQLRSELSSGAVHRVPLDSLVADTQGSIGYMIQRALREDLRLRGHTLPVIAVVTEVEVDPHDRAFEEPSKPIGRFYDADEANQLRAQHGWPMVEVPRRGWRRVVPSPAPVAIVQIEVIEMLARQGITVICCGGGGIPITRNPDGHIVGHEAVIDKDRSSMLLAVALGARRLVITTEVDCVYRDYVSDHPVPLPELTSAEAAELADAGEFPAGSMGPKIEAAIRYLENIDGEVIICSPSHIVAALAGESGTRITREGRKSP